MKKIHFLLFLFSLKALELNAQSYESNIQTIDPCATQGFLPPTRSDGYSQGFLDNGGGVICSGAQENRRANQNHRINPEDMFLDYPGSYKFEGNYPPKPNEASSFSHGNPAYWSNQTGDRYRDFNLHDNLPIIYYNVPATYHNPNGFPDCIPPQYIENARPVFNQQPVPNKKSPQSGIHPGYYEPFIHESSPKPYIYERTDHPYDYRGPNPSVDAPPNDNPKDSYLTDNDREINTKIRDRISGWSANGYENLRLNTANGLVTTEGFVPTHADKTKLNEFINEISEVRGLYNFVQIKQTQ